MKKRLFKILTPCLLLLSHLYSYEPLSFETISTLSQRVEKKGESAIWNTELENFHQKEVALRGFLGKSEEGRWILTEKPGVSSCCHNAVMPLTSQIVFLDGDFQSYDINRALLVKGIFAIDIQRDEQGTPTQIYKLTETAPHLSKHRRIPLGLLVLLGSSAMGGALYVKKRKAKQK